MKEECLDFKEVLNGCGEGINQSKLCNFEGLNKVWVNLGNVDLIIF